MKTRLTVILTVAVYLVLAASPAATASQVKATDFQGPESRTAGIQEAVDALPPEGGIVYLPAGTYEVARAIHLRSGVYVRGDGDHTVVARAEACLQVELAAAARRGQKQVAVRDASGLKVGNEVCVRSDSSHGWWCTHTLITGIQDNTVSLADTLTHTHLPPAAWAANLFPCFYADSARDIRIEDLCIDGRMTERDRETLSNDFTLSAVHFRDVSDCLVARVHVKSYPGDGISIQIGDNATVTGCLSEYNLGHGFHPGTGITSGAWTYNVGRYNGWDGLFFCHRVRHSIMSGNRFDHNGWNGIGGLGIGGEGGDRYNVVSGNFCSGNGKSGIECRVGGNNIVSNNVCENNSRSEPGRWPGILVEDTYGSIISGNRCLDFQQPDSARTQGYGILVTGQSRDNIITGNLVTGCIKGGVAGEALYRNVVADNLVRQAHTPAGM
ncbi:MAG: right-handed parallel beta-helix repeat-containing protein [Candidatus Glassbacteria bacterium]|nr:right-handed parallel beta-helix repeat-containing protein [Candidatus Glassbacteria bacterium]